MPFDGNGNWVSNFSAEADRDAGYKILASRFDNIFIADIAAGFGNCVTRDGQGIMQTNTNANNYRVINVADPINDQDAVNLRTLRDGDLTITGNVDFTGTVTAPTPADATDSSTKVATTAWVAGHRCTTPATTTSTASVNAPAYIVENYKDGTEWYRVWSDGWIEQGGMVPASSNNMTVTTFKKEFSDTNYNIQITAVQGEGFGNAYDLTTTSCRVCVSGGDKQRRWYASGY